MTKNTLYKYLKCILLVLISKNKLHSYLKISYIILKIYLFAFKFNNKGLTILSCFN